MCYAGAICYIAGKIRLLYVPWLGDGTLLKCLPDGSVCKCPSWPRSYSCTYSSGDWKRCAPRHVHKWSAVEVMLCGVICTTGSHQLPTSGCCCVQIWHLGERWLPFFFYSSRIKCWLKVLVLFFNSLLINSIFAVYTLKYLTFFFSFSLLFIVLPCIQLRRHRTQMHGIIPVMTMCWVKLPLQSIMASNTTVCQKWILVVFYPYVMHSDHFLWVMHFPPLPRNMTASTLPAVLNWVPFWHWCQQLNVTNVEHRKNGPQWLLTFLTECSKLEITLLCYRIYFSWEQDLGNRQKIRKELEKRNSKKFLTDLLLDVGRSW